jgi:O-antigen/teichoic acid export membrane protein
MPMPTETATPETSFPLGQQVARGALWGVLSVAVATPLNLAVTAYALSRLGPETYGVWVLIAVLGNYLRLGDFGLSAAFARVVAEQLTRGEKESLGRSLSSVVTIILLSGLCFCAAAWLLRKPILFGLFAIPESYNGQAEAAFGLMLCATLAVLLTPAFASLLTGAQRTDVDKQISACVNIILSLFTAAALGMGWGLVGIAGALAASSVIGLLTTLAVSRRVVPGVPIRPFRHIDYADAWRIVRFGGGLQLTQAAMQVVTQADRLFIAHYASVALAGKYDVALRALYSVQGALNQLVAPLYPAAAAMNASGRTEEMRRWLERSTRLFSVLTGPVYGLICVGAPAIVQAWLGRPEPHIAMTLSVLAAIQGWNQSNAPGYFMLVGSGRLRPVLAASLVAAAVGLMLSWAGAATVGYAGVVAAHACALLILFGWVALAIQRAFGRPVWSQLAVVPVPFLVGALEGWGLLLLAPNLGSSRLLILALAGLVTLPGLVILWSTPYIRTEDRQALSRMFRPRSARVA